MSQDQLRPEASTDRLRLGARSPGHLPGWLGMQVLSIEAGSLRASLLIGTGRGLMSMKHARDLR